MDYILWRDYGSEGWQPSRYKTEQELLETIKCGSYGKIMLTQEIELLIKRSPNENT